jgi:pyruvate dehydrogenase E1 component alpha subunit
MKVEFADLREELLYRALRIRRVEERVIRLYPSDKIQSPVHLSIGQEAVAVGVCHALTPYDLLFCSYRSHAFYLAKDGDLGAMLAELYGKATGCGRGKAGSMHLAAPDVGLMGASAVVASTVPHAVGAALAAKRLGKAQVIVAAFGDGATDQGVYHESLNYAALHQLPVLFLCEDNGLAVHSRPSARQAYRIAEHAAVYGLPVTTVAEGWDPLAVHEAVSGVIREVRERRTPRFVHVHTMRYREHVGPGEDWMAGYRSRDELERWQARDPLVQDRALIAKFEAAILAEIDDAVAFAEQSPWPDATQLLADVL